MVEPSSGDSNNTSPAPPVARRTARRAGRTRVDDALTDLLPEWRAVCDDSGRPRISGGPTALPRLYFVGQFVAPSGMLREMGIEARRVAADISGTPQPSVLDRAKALTRR